mmetsp:Transcript_10714/g.31020  ORF Transcript_10714/g.31020 Transcript_10714/m.31020 type:complete len:92 (-) Transcript_10714:60-335(-)
MDNGEVVTESAVVARRVATEFRTRHTNLLPSAETAAIDAFVGVWTRQVEPAYYTVLKAESETQVRTAVAGLLETLRAVEASLWERTMARGG